MNEDIYWEAQWVIGGLEEMRADYGADTLVNDLLDVLLQIKL